MQHAICRHAISLNIILVKPTKCVEYQCCCLPPCVPNNDTRYARIGTPTACNSEQNGLEVVLLPTLSKMHKMHIGILIGNKKAIPESRWIYG